MIDFIQYWFLLPVGIVIATLYTSTGISGANFWAPVYLLWLKVEPLVGFWLALVSMLFGSAGGLIGHLRQGTIDFSLVKSYAMISVPFAVFGALLLPYVRVSFLFLVFGLFVLGYGAFLYYKTVYVKEEKLEKHSKIHYFFGAIGGFLTGMVSVGLGKLILPHCIKHKKINHHAVAVGTVMTIVFVTSLVATLVRLNSSFVASLGVNLDLILGMLLYAAPGVLIGGQVGPRVAKYLNLKQMRIYVSVLLVIVGVLMLFRFFT